MMRVYFVILLIALLLAFTSVAKAEERELYAAQVSVYIVNALPEDIVAFSQSLSQYLVDEPNMYVQLDLIQPMPPEELSGDEPAP